MTTRDGALHRWLYGVWYEGGRGGWLLLPLEWFYRGVIALRRSAYRRGWRRQLDPGAPVIVVGNISAGGSGKTPLVGWLASALATRGYRPAVIARGYGGSVGDTPVVVTEDTLATVCGDEPAMLRRELADVPIVVCPDRVAAARVAIEQGARVLISDDGLQHYRLSRAVEIAIVDGQRRHGNGHCLPAGPLREPVSRLDSVDLVVTSGVHDHPGCSFTLASTDALNAITGERRPLQAFAGSEVWAFAGIAHPERFFDALRAQGIEPVATALRDHAVADEATLEPPGDAPVMMTAKDAVKYEGHLRDRHWVVRARLEMDADSEARLWSVIEPVLEGLPDDADISTLHA